MEKKNTVQEKQKKSFQHFPSGTAFQTVAPHRAADVAQRLSDE
jgi:hypothetical protein